jgi:hypothetical protein
LTLGAVVAVGVKGTTGDLEQLPPGHGDFLGAGGAVRSSAPVGIAPVSGNKSKNAASPVPFPLPCKIKEAWMQPASTRSAGTSRQIPSARSENAPKRRVNPYRPERFMTG